MNEHENKIVEKGNADKEKFEEFTIRIASTNTKEQKPSLNANKKGLTSTQKKKDSYYPYGKYLNVSEHRSREALRRMRCDKEGKIFKPRKWKAKKNGISVGYGGFDEHVQDV
mmetsp:Transcript_36843/g.59062  ORF Transcript_36843/g.59062 Transcript_36843/m.59062 type:complete len:112 (-) Transcript_36843:363-698(-)|eukprot:jgi/Bigna1/87146/estExt_fgenesh1_pg.C_170070